MNDGSHDTAGGRPHERVDLELSFATMRQLQSELAPVLSSDGLFVAAEEPPPTDTVVHFRITLPEGFVLIEGTGVVIWTRGGADEGEPGMGIRYVSLSRGAQETIDAIIDSHLAAGGDLFSLEPDDDQAETFPTDALGGGASPGHGRAAARRGTTQEELERARVTIRADPTSSRTAMESLDEEYLTAIEDQVEASSAGFAGGDERRREGAARLPFEPSPSADGSAREGDLDEPVAPAAEPVGEDEDDTLEILEMDYFAAAEELVAERPDDSGEELKGRAGGPGEPAIPSFLDGWGREVGDARVPAGRAAGPVDRPGEGGSGAAAGGQAQDAGPPIGVRVRSITEDEENEPSEEELGAEGPMASPAEGGGDTAAEMTELGETEDAPHAVTARAASGAGRRRLRWLLPLLVVLALAALGYVERDRVRELIGPQPATVRAAAPAEAPPVEPAPAPPSAATGVEAVGTESVEAVTEESQVPAEEAPEPAAEPVSAPPVEPAAPPREPLAPATAVTDITFHEVAAATEVVVQANGAVTEDAVSVFPMRDPARILIRVRGIEEGYPHYELPAGTPELERIRIGHHPELKPPALYVVLDLADPAVAMSDLAVEGDTIRVTVAAQ